MSRLGKETSPDPQPQAVSQALADVAVRTPSRRRHRWTGGAMSLLAHAVALTLLFGWTVPARVFDPPAIAVSLVQEPKPAPPAPPAKPEPPKAPKAKPRPMRTRVVARRTPVKPLPARHIAKLAPAHADPAPRHSEALANGEADVSDAELAGAAMAGSGEGGGACNMAQRLQEALRRDPLVRAAVAQAGGRAIRIWNGDWVQHQGEDGKGLSAVREAITWEVAFAPKDCRSEPVHGLILISLNGAGRLVLGSGDWRWSDLLTIRSGVR